MSSDEEIRAHFDRRAPEYDHYWLGTGPFAGRDRPGFAAEVDELVALLRALPPARVLDVACGTGFLTQHLRGDVVALDQSPRMVEIAAARMPRARVQQGEALALPFADGAFDRVFTSLFFHHLAPADRTAFLAEARRVAPELVVVEDAHFSAADLTAALGPSRVLHDGRWFVVVAA